MEGSDGMTAEFPQSKKPRPYSVIDDVEPQRDETPADGDDYTWAPSSGTIEGSTVHLQILDMSGAYDLRTGPERARMEVDDLAARVRRLEAQLSGEIRQLAERLQQVEHILEQCTGDYR